MKKLIALLTVIVILLSMTTLPAAAAEDYPEPAREFFVNDFADQLSQDTENRIINLGRQLEEKTGAQVVLVTINSLNGQDIDEYRNKLFEKWQIGKKGEDNGVLIVFARAERQLGIEVGYGLEGALPDSRVARIREDNIKPYTQEPGNDFDSGLYSGYLAIANVVAEEYNVKLDGAGTGAGKVPQQPVQPYSERSRSSGIGIIFVILFLAIDGIFFRFRITSALIKIALISGFFRGGRGGRGGGWGGGGGFGGGGGGWGGSSGGGGRSGGGGSSGGI